MSTKNLFFNNNNELVNCFMKQYAYYVLKHYRNNVNREGYSHNVYIAHLGSRVEGVNGSMRLAASPLQFII